MDAVEIPSFHVKPEPVARLGTTGFRAGQIGRAHV